LAPPEPLSLAPPELLSLPAEPHALKSATAPMAHAQPVETSNQLFAEPRRSIMRSPSRLDHNRHLAGKARRELCIGLKIAGHELYAQDAQDAEPAPAPTTTTATPGAAVQRQ
jgi:hypothetical protein